VPVAASAAAADACSCSSIRTFCTSKASKVSTCGSVGRSRPPSNHRRAPPSALHVSHALVVQPTAYVRIRQHTSAYVCMSATHSLCSLQHTSAYVRIRQHTSAYVRIRPHTSACVSIRQHTSACMSATRSSCSLTGQLRQHLYFCTSKASKVSTVPVSAACVRRRHHLN